MTLKTLKTSEHAVSEVVDFVILLGVMLLAVSVIGVAGFPLIDHMQEVEHTENIKQSYTVLGANINKIVFGNAPSQSIELQMRGGSLSITGNSLMNITLKRWNSTSDSYEYQVFERQMRIIENRFEGTSICYENTGTWAKYPAGESVAITHPRFSFNGDVLVMPVTLVSGSSSQSGQGVVRVVSDGGHSNVYSYQNVSEVDVRITSKYYEGWGTYFDDTMNMDVAVYDVNNTIIAHKNYSDNIDVHIVYSPMSATIE
ncbi:hypothetical protein [Methanohalobium sp.]|uniref:DUF7289 family protein n=1 Tax=Methanohalobium sp. TaxID=2837493 RepID=UPI0025E98067|nr:hypothetical protein [Methanohalobium sp.]